MKSSQGNIILSPDFPQAGEWMESLPKVFEREGELLFRRRNILKQFASPCGVVVAKKYKMPGFPGRVFQEWIHPSKAHLAFDNSKRLLSLGIDTPAPVGFHFRRKGLILKEEYYVCLKEELPTALSLIRKGNGIDGALADALASHIAYMHSKGVRHNDLTLSNFLVERNSEGFRFSMVDTDRCTFHESMSSLQCFWDLRRVSRDKEVHRRIMRSYAICRGWNPEKTLRKVDFLKAIFEMRKKLLFASRDLRALLKKK